MTEAKKEVKYIRYVMFNLKKPLEDGNGHALLQWSSRAGFPRINCYTDKDWFVDGKIDYNKVITAPFDNLTILTLLDNFKKVIESKVEIKFITECWNVVWSNNVKTDQKKLSAKVIIGKDKNLVNYIALLEEGKKRIKFPILPNNDYVKFYDENEVEISDPAKLSDMFGKVYLENLTKVLQAETIVESTKSLEDKIGKPTKTVKFNKTESKPTETSSSSIDITENIDDLLI